MPMINFSYTRGAFRPEREHAMAGVILAILLRHHIAAKLMAQLAPVTCLKVFQLEPAHYLVAGEISEKPRYDIEIVVPDGSVDGDRRDRIVREMTEALLEEEGIPWNEDDAQRVWIIIRDVPDGRWAVGGCVVTAKSILQYLIKKKLQGKREAASARSVGEAV